MGAGSDDNGTMTGFIGFSYAGNTVDNTACRKIRPLNVLHKTISADIRIIHQGQGGIDNLPHIVAGDIGGHADSNTGGTVDQKVREAVRHN